MNYTSRMLELLVAIRRERNGEVADAMRYYGAAYGLNYGVSIHTLRSLVRHEATDHHYARYLWQQDVRELRMAALWIADPSCLNSAERPFWAAGIINSELAEEAAFALLSRTPHLDSLFEEWSEAQQPILLAYTALLGASRMGRMTINMAETLVDLVHRNPDERLVAQGVVALLASMLQNKESRVMVLHLLSSLGASPCADLIHEEITWRLEV